MLHERRVTAMLRLRFQNQLLTFSTNKDNWLSTSKSKTSWKPIFSSGLVATMGEVKTANQPPGLTVVYD